jgi:dTMP kinase
MVPSNKKGFLVTFEGIDGCGKTTQAILTCRLLEAHGHQTKLLREPGSTRAAERIRDLLLDKDLDIDPLTELLLYEAARASITAAEIAPWLDRGNVVVCDRFYDSTTAYQGYGRELDIGMIRRLNRIAVGGLAPDLSLFFDVDLDTAQKRRTGEPDRLEMQSSAFFRRVRQGFLEIARSERRRVKVVDASQSVEDVFADVKKILARRIDLK